MPATLLSRIRAAAALTLCALLCAQPAFCAAPPSAEYLKAVGLMKAERYKEAIPLFESEARRNPGSADILMNLGWAYWHVHDYEQSWKVWDLMAKLDPTNPAYVRMLADLEIERKDYRGALALADRALRRAPDDRDALLVKVKALQRLGRDGEADRLLKALLRRYPSNPGVLFANADRLAQVGRLDESLVYYDKLLHLDAATPDYRRGRANLLYRLGRYGEAIAEWTALAQGPSPDEKSMLDLGWAAWRDRKYDSALGWGRKLVLRHPDDPLYLRFLANIDLEVGDDGEALDLAGRALGLKPADKEVRLLQAKALFRLQRDKEAMASLTGLLERDPDDPKLEFNMGDFLEMLGREKEALPYYDKLVDEFPDNLSYRKHRAETYYELGQFDKAVAEWKLLTEKAPFDPQPYQRLIDDSLNRGAWEDGLYWLRELAGVRPLGALDWLRLAQVYYRMHLLPQSLDAAQKGHETDPTVLANLFFACDLLEEMRRYDEALPLAERLLQLNPNSERALWSLARIYEGLGERSRAVKIMDTLQSRRFSGKTSPPYIALYQARLLADMGRIEDAWRKVKKLDGRDRTSIPILLYHSVSQFKRSDQVDEALFRGQMLALKKAGYHAITLDELARFFDGKGGLPDKPVLITFDDGRLDALRAADPILAETGMKATMFVILGGMQTERFHASLGDLRKYEATGRWELALHAYNSHVMAPIDASHEAAFLANRLWLPAQGRLETHEEAAKRIETDMTTGVERFAEYFPEDRGKAAGFAFPFGDDGSQDYTNDPELTSVDERMIDEHFRFGFTQDQYGFALAGTKKSEVRRYEVPKDMTGQGLMRHLQVDDPWTRLRMMEGQLWIEAGQPVTALAFYDQVKDRGVDAPDFATQDGIAYERVGNPYYARRLYASAVAQDPGNDRYRMLQDQSDANARPHVGAGGSAFSDSDARANDLAKVQTDAVGGPLNLNAWAGEGGYHQTGFTTIQSKEYGAGVQASVLPKIRLDGDFSERDFRQGAGRIDQNYDSALNLLAFHGATLSARTGFVNAETAAAIADGIRYHDYGGSLAYDVAMNWSLTGSYDRSFFTDGNREYQARGQLMRKLNRYVSVGYQLWTGNSAFQNTILYWTPSHLTQNMGVAAVDWPLGRQSEATGKRAVELTGQYGAGYGVNAGLGRAVQSVSSGLVWHLSDILAVQANGNYLDTPNYISRTVTAGISLTY